MFYEIFFYCRTKGPKISFTKSVQDLSIREIFLIAQLQLKTQFQYKIVPENTEISLIFTRNGRNVHQFLADQTANLSTFYPLKTHYRFDEIFYFQISERFFDPNSKYFEKTVQSPLVVGSIPTPRSEVERILSKIYPVPFFISQQILAAPYNAFLDKTNSQIVVGTSYTEAIQGIGENTSKAGNFYFEIILRLPNIFSRIYNNIQKLFYKLKIYGYQNGQNLSCQLVFALRFPVFPFVITMIVNSVIQCVLLYFSSFLRGSNFAEIVANFLKVLAFNFIFKLVFHSNSVILPPKIIFQLWKIIDPLGQNNRVFHYLFDEVFRADTETRNRGGFNRNQQAPELREIGVENGIQFEIAKLEVLEEIFKSLSPWYRVN
ncbi:hypothetical protein SS50377_27846 [Spironucleus salmonicida]|uniref:Transmembrane domain-containing protein n=1 Tax=Spironucleus salmonicida TaxID=348837 RepID=V6M638_9EUKA|nr:hypothetical protein SS50377_27846 [Spironucleus salmonicida]|eukprot:EST48839.1 Transmembrane domain-containing protein [Spironucleus salmonicida]